ncbi:MAG: nucleoside triphosphate pyrophosphohydrolase [Desulfobacterales bacterium]|nr:MAG: nucleoside triphosphate pyrophosphohydrolase [Desulfobacterales bacterium]
MENSKLEPEISPLNALITLIETLRGGSGCPWDKKQTPHTMAVYLIEEMYELVHAIDSGSPQEVCEEMGDVLFHIFFIARLFQEKRHFTIQDVARQCTEKMIRRHPHVFGTTRVSSSDEVTQNWHRIKAKEKKGRTEDSVLDSVPANLPALMRAYRISDRAAGTGFDWDDPSDVWDKLEEELEELKSALARKDKDEVTNEFGDVLFTLTNVARFAKIHPETALAEAVKKFETRFRQMEEIIARSGRPMEAVSPNEKDRIWEHVKSLNQVTV